MAERFVQFSGLIDKYENPKPNQNPVTPTDLKGFWEMIYYQVTDVAKKFESLEKLKENNWQREELVEKRVTRKKKAPKSAKGSSAHRRAARKRIKEAREAMKAKLKEAEQEGGKPSTSHSNQQQVDDALTEDEGVVTRSRRKTPGKNVSFATPSKKRKARFAVENSDDETKSTPAASQPRKRVMRKTPLPGVKPDSNDEVSSCTEDAQASPSFKKRGYISEISPLESGNNPLSCDIKGVKLNFDDIESDNEKDDSFAKKYLVPTETENKNATSKSAGIDMKYLMPCPSVADSLEDVDSPVPQTAGNLTPKSTERPQLLTNPSVADSLNDEPVNETPTRSDRVLRSNRKSLANPFSPFIKPLRSAKQETAECTVAVVDDLISFSPLPMK